MTARRRYPVTYAAALCVGVAVAVRAAVGTAAEYSAGGLVFSDELGGFTLLGASGTGTRDDPVHLVEVLHGDRPAVLVVRRQPGQIINHTVLKEITNGTGRAWSGFDLELREILSEPSTYGDGLSFNQTHLGSALFQSDLFGHATAMHEPADRVTFSDGGVGADEIVQLRFRITDISPIDTFYLIQEPLMPMAARPTRLACLAPLADQRVTVVPQSRFASPWDRRSSDHAE